MAQPWGIRQVVFGARPVIDTIVWPSSAISSGVIDLVDILPANHENVWNHSSAQPDAGTRLYADTTQWSEPRWVVHWYVRADITVFSGGTADQRLVLTFLSGIDAAGVLYPVAQIPFLGVPKAINFGTGVLGASSPKRGPDLQGSMEISGRLFQAQCEANPSSLSPSDFRLCVSLRAV